MLPSPSRATQTASNLHLHTSQASIVKQSEFPRNNLPLSCEREKPARQGNY